jgi:hypothetical protein
MAMMAYCYGLRKVSSSVGALALDHLADVVTNGGTLVAVIVASRRPSLWWFDPAAAILLSVWMVVMWSDAAREQIGLLASQAASREDVSVLTYTALTHHRSILAVDTVLAYNVGNKLQVEGACAAALPRCRHAVVGGDRDVYHAAADDVQCVPHRWQCAGLCPTPVHFSLVPCATSPRSGHRAAARHAPDRGARHRREPAAQAGGERRRRARFRAPRCVLLLARGWAQAEFCGNGGSLPQRRAAVATASDLFSVARRCCRHGLRAQQKHRAHFPVRSGLVHDRSCGNTGGLRWAFVPSSLVYRIDTEGRGSGTREILPHVETAPIA